MPSVSRDGTLIPWSVFHDLEHNSQKKTTNKKRGFISHVIVKSASDGTDFDFYIDDGSGIKLFERISVDGTLNEEVRVPVDSPLEFVIENSTADELHKIYIAIEE